MQHINEAFLRLIPNISIENDSIFSNTAITVEKLAKVMNRKNKAPQSLPPAILVNILGRVTNISDGPASGSTPNEKHAGKMIIPDTIATKVSSTHILAASPGRLCSLLM